VDLDLGGKPLHARSLEVTLADAGSGRWRARGVVFDLRKCGFVPVGGDLQTAGVIHHMQVDAQVERSSLRLEQIEVAQPAVAFEASPVSGGESCRDPAARVRGLAGSPLDAEFARRAAGEIGGPRGCTHVLTLVQLVGATLPWARQREHACLGGPPERAPGERVFRRVLVFDGALAGGQLELAAQLSDILFRPSPERAPPLDRLAEELELRLQARIEPQTQRLVALRGARRRRGVEDLESAAWADLATQLEGLEGLALRAGVGREILRQQAERGSEGPLLDALLNLTPAFFQCLANISERGPLEAKHTPSVLGMAGPPDSCFMWRRGGGLDRARGEGGGGQEADS
jgi:hypothetical protein